MIMSYDDKISKIEELLTRVNVNAETGSIRWTTSGTGRKEMALAGSITSSGYRSIWADGNRIQYHQVLFYYQHGYVPQGGRVIDHIDRNKLNNRIDNLRDVSIAKNAQNNDSKGVSLIPSTGQWMAYLHRDGVNHYLGVYDNEALASEARSSALLDYDFGIPIKNKNVQRLSKRQGDKQ